MMCLLLIRFILFTKNGTAFHDSHASRPGPASRIPTGRLTDAESPPDSIGAALRAWPGRTMPGPRPAGRYGRNTHPRGTPRALRDGRRRNQTRRGAWRGRRPSPPEVRGAVAVRAVTQTRPSRGSGRLRRGRSYQYRVVRPCRRPAPAGSGGSRTVDPAGPPAGMGKYAPRRAWPGYASFRAHRRSCQDGPDGAGHTGTWRVPLRYRPGAARAAR